jgi:prepilin-type N-terminal cleavage/methylation domain-containing protein
MKLKSNLEKYKKVKDRFSRLFSSTSAKNPESGQAGFSLVEVTIAMVIFLIAILGVFISFTYAFSYNAGNASRAQALALLQRKVEEMRSAKFVPTSTDPSLAGGHKTAEVVTGSDGHRYKLQVDVDDDPFTTGIQTDATKTLKEVTVTVSLERPTPGWQTSVPVKVVLRRVRGN